MWYPAAQSGAAPSEPVTADEARAQTAYESTDQDTLFDRLITAARAHIEAYCGTRLATQTVIAKCDGFDDMARLPEGPVQSVTSIQYIDTAGTTQTLSTNVYELRADGIEAAVVLKYNQVWPAIRLGSRITLTAVVGYSAVPADVKHALLLLISHWFEHRQASGETMTPLPMGVEALLSNHRRGV